MNMDAFMQALSAVLAPSALFYMFIGVLFGILCGAMPGLSAVMAVSIMLPFTFGLKDVGIMMLLGIFCGAVYGGSITAILINTPGTANSAATCLDGYPMAHKYGQPGRALSISTMASTFGGLFSALMLLWIAPLLSKIALNFGVTEMFALGVFGLSIVTAVSSHSIIKGLLGAVLGLLLGSVGMDTTSATFRYTFGTTYLISGIQFVPLLIGLFAFSQCLLSAEEDIKSMAKSKAAKLTQILPSKSDIKQTAPTILMSSVIGTVIGAIPGTGGDIASWIGYNEAKRFSKHPEKFGDGAPEGIAAPEAANNAVSGGAMIPLLTLGIPGDSVTAIMLGALMMQGIAPGPLLFTTQTTKVYTIIVSLFVANIFMCLLGYIGIRGFAKISMVPMKWLNPIIFVFCTVGTFAINNNMGDVFLMIGAGILGYVLVKLDFCMPPIILGLILSGTVEENLRRALVLSDGSLSIFLSHPIAMALLAVAAISLMTPVVMKAWKQRSAAKSAN